MGPGIKVEMVWNWGFCVNWAGSASSPCFGYWYRFADCGSATCQTGATSSFRNCPYMLRNVVGWAVQELIAKMKFFDSLIHEFNLGLFRCILKLLVVSWCCGMKIQKCSSEFFSLRNQNFGCFRLFQPGWRPYMVKSVKNQVSQKSMNLVKIEN